VQNWLDELKAEKESSREAAESQMEAWNRFRSSARCCSSESAPAQEHLQSLGVISSNNWANIIFKPRHLYPHHKYSAERTKAMLDAVDAADLILLVFPLYVDSLPAPVMNALEQIAAHRQTKAKPSLINYSPPYRIADSRTGHNATALRSAKTCAANSF